MKYLSTRNSELRITASEAILKGISDDGGLFVPETIPHFNVSTKELTKMSYREIAYEVMKLFFTDFTESELKNCIDSAYDEKFDIPEICAVHPAANAYFLELFHGKTIAFKDMALSILPHLLTTAARKNGVKEEVVILTATSGDTGKAALSGFSDVPGTRIIVYYPKAGVSRIQELQMVTEKGKNTCVIAINGNFDDAQSRVKQMFADKTFTDELKENGFVLSSANSINIGRLVPQIVYYVWGYSRMIMSGAIKENEPINITVPTGNFGNILAAWYAKKMGLPVNRLICASNRNKVLFDFFETGTYDKNRDFYLTTSPSMDILVSSNLERLLFYACGENSEELKSLMGDLKNKGKYTVSDSVRFNLSDFSEGYADDEKVSHTIKEIFDKYNYVIDTHTAVAASVYADYATKTSDTTKTLIASTASPYKFPRAVLKSITGDTYESTDDLKLTDILNGVSGVPVPGAVKDLKTAQICHNTVCDPCDMEKSAKNFLKIDQKP